MIRRSFDSVVSVNSILTENKFLVVHIDLKLLIAPFLLALVVCSPTLFSQVFSETAVAFQGRCKVLLRIVECNDGPIFTFSSWLLPLRFFYKITVRVC